MQIKDDSGEENEGEKKPKDEEQKVSRQENNEAPEVTVENMEDAQNQPQLEQIDEEGYQEV